MKVENIRIGKSALGDRIYAGELSKECNAWKGDKKDVTNDFYHCVIQMFAGYETEVYGEEGKRYKVVVEEIEE